VATKRSDAPGADLCNAAKDPWSARSIRSPQRRASTDGGTVGELSEPIFVAASERGLESGCWGFVLNEGGVSAGRDIDEREPVRVPE